MPKHAVSGLRSLWAGLNTCAGINGGLTFPLITPANADTSIFAPINLEFEHEELNVSIGAFVNSDCPIFEESIFAFPNPVNKIPLLHPAIIAGFVPEFGHIYVSKPYSGRAAKRLRCFYVALTHRNAMSIPNSRACGFLKTSILDANVLTIPKGILPGERAPA